MTNADLLNLLQDQVKNHSTNIIGDSLARNWLDEGQIDIVNRTGCLSQDAQMDSVADQREYTLASDILEITHIKYYNGTKHVPLDGTTENKMEEYGDYPDETAVVSPTHYFIKQGATPKLNLYPTPSTTVASAIKYRYVPRPADLTNEGLDPNIPEMYHRLIVKYALAVCLQKDKKFNTSDRYMAQYEQELARMQYRMKNFDQKHKMKMVPFSRQHKRRNMASYDD
jgi:hypothetical protein